MAAVTLRALNLGADAALEALPLLQVVWPTVTADAWLSYLGFVTMRSASHGAGVVVLRDTAGYICGVMVFEVERDLEEGRVLTVPLFLAIDLANSSAPVHCLLDAARAKAAHFMCNGLQIRLYDGQSGVAGHVRGQGFIDRAGYLWASTRKT